MIAERLYTSGRYFILSAVFLLFTGLGIAGFVALAGPIPFAKALIITIPVVLLCGVPAYAGRFICRFFSVDWTHLSRTIAVQVVFIGIASLLLVVTWLLYCSAITFFLPHYLEVNTVIRILPVIATLTIILLVFAQVVHYFVLMLEDKKRASEELLAQKLATAEAELALVKSTIHPHFLFNSLAMLSSLVRSDPVATEKALEDLSEFLIYSVRFGNRTEVPFEDEIAHSMHYAKIEHLRGINEFTLTVKVTDECKNCIVLPFIVQPLVENALKHGIRLCPAGGEITISAHIQDTYLHISVTNPVPDGSSLVQKKESESGTGLKTLEKRLQRKYGAQAKLALQNSDNVYTVSLKIPLTTGMM